MQREREGERLFGTDGVRGIANQDLTCELAMLIGAAGAHVLTSEVRSPRILIGCDTRKSSEMLMAALAAGICSMGGEVLRLDVIPTPAMAYLVRAYEADAAVMVSASHNSMEFNGIKWFDRNGRKLSDAIEDKIEEIVYEAPPRKPLGEGVGSIVRALRAQEEYREGLLGCSPNRFGGMSIVLDCANGASARIAPEVFRALGANVLTFADEPDGCNINEKCGSTYPARLQELVREHGADAGFAFDGDADRLIATDERGNIIDGDRIVGILALDMKRSGKLKNDTVAITIVSNMGLKATLRDAGVKTLETAVGDRYVLEAMTEHGLALGGEQSGHVILLDYNTTGDGILSAISLLNVCVKTDSKLSKLASGIAIFPQVNINVRVENAVKPKVLNDPELKRRVQEAEKELSGKGRVLVRVSGTEPVIRIMLEGEDSARIESLGIHIAKAIEENFGGKMQQSK